LSACVFSAVICLVASDARGAETKTGTLIASKEPGWPQWRGPRRDGISDETGLLQSWPKGGPKVLWTASGLGRGYSSPIITRGTIYITGDVGKELHIFALDLDGKVKWQAKNGRAWTKNYRGARGSCTYDQGRLYHMNGHARLASFDPATGEELWAVNVLERFEAKNICWGISESLLIDGPRVIVTPGGKKGLMAALDRNTGKTVWATEPLIFERTVAFGGRKLRKPVRDADGANHASPILFELGGRRHIVGCSSRHAFGVDAETGKLLWTRPMPTRWEVLGIAPVLYNDAVFVTGPDGRGGKLFRIHVDGPNVRVEEAWTTAMDTCHGGVVLVDGLFYGSWYRGFNGWGCVDGQTGKTRYRTPELAMGSVTYADGRLYCLSQRGVVALLKPTPTGFEFTGRFRLTDGRRRDAWAHPVICDGRLYLRYHDNLYCYDIRQPQRRP